METVLDVLKAAAAVYAIVLTPLQLAFHVSCAYIVVTISEAGNGTTRWDSASDLPNSVADQYFHAYYEAITVTGGKSMQPTTTLEVFTSGVMPVVGVTIQAWYVYKTQVYDVAPPPQPTILTTAAMHSNSTVGLCAGVFAQIHHVEDDCVQRTDAIHAKLKNCHVEPAVQNLPTTLTLQLQWTLHEAFMRKVPFFQSLEPEGLLTLLQCIEEWVALTGDVIIPFYLIQTGSVDVFLKGSNKKRILLKHLGPGDFFGEMSLIGDATAGDGGRSCRTTANVEATSFCTFQVLYKELFLVLTTQNEQLKAFLTQARAQRLADAKHGQLKASAQEDENTVNLLLAVRGRREVSTGAMESVNAMSHLTTKCVAEAKRVTLVNIGAGHRGPPPSKP
ncbi:hypothetical protein DYB37_004668 [Aphanomyces astaci]|uniref:Cyclic nucleotide-binding domain-containing protein n=1 Tax=Aphanomyces astaci TaxID=112090 RepID=A0A3R6X284_APHAT|nr:hypothetical protein DYB35_006236 [Aphanomyces astaci]RHZ17734.1 hypothetical protein DYB37_004668 [Aphanomyces astaci]